MLTKLSGLSLKCLDFSRKYTSPAWSMRRACVRFTSSVSEQTDVNTQMSTDIENNVVIIGGGVVGCSIAYHLAKVRGQRGITLLEKSDLTAGSTWHAAGLTTYFHPSINPKKIHFYSMNLYKKLQKETEQGIGLHTPGSLRLCTTPARVDEAKYQMSRQGWNQAEQYLIQPDQIERMCPILNMRKILCAIFNPGDGHVDPYLLTQALATGAREGGANIQQNTEVLAVKQLPHGKWEITTNKSSLIATHVVNAAGFWAKEVAMLSGINIPLVPIHHQYVITGSIPEIKALNNEIPVLRDLEGSYYLRQEKDALLFGPYENVDRMSMSEDWVENGVPKHFGKELFPPDLDRIMPNVEKAMEMVPLLKTADIKTIINGPITYSPESAPLLGCYQGVHNYWLAAGFGYGIIQAGGAGRYIADWIVDGEPPHELIDLDANRFSKWCTKEFSIVKARETYGLNNMVGYPKEERWAGRPTTRKGILYEALKRKGAEFGFHNGWEQPHWFSTNQEEQGYNPSFYRSPWFPAVLRECRAVLNNVAIIDLSPFAKIKITGTDSAKFIDYITANTVPDIGKTCITHMITPQGKVYAELTISRLSESSFLVLTGSASELHDIRWMEEHLWKTGLKVHISNITDEYGAIGVAGPKSRDLLQPLTKSKMGADHFKFLTCREIVIGGISVIAIRISYTGELGWELYCPKERLPELYQRLTGDEKGSQLTVSDFGAFAMNALRLEKGFRMWNAEMNKDTNPYEAGLGMFIRLNKEANFIGKEALQKIKASPLKRRLVFLTLSEDHNYCDPEGNESVWYHGKVIGNTTSGCFGPQLTRSLAFAYIPSELAVTGTQVDVELLGKKCPAFVSLSAPILVHAARERIEMKMRQ